jgi:hypothetical protein
VENDLQAIVADKGDHSMKVVTLAADFRVRSYIPERAFAEAATLDRQSFSRPAGRLQRAKTDAERSRQAALATAKRTHRAILRPCQ